MHVIGRGHEAVFDLNCPTGPVELRENYGFSRREIRQIVKILDDHLAELCRAWEKFMALRDDFERAGERAKELESRVPRAVAARYDRKTGRVVIELSSKLIVSFLPPMCKGSRARGPRS